MGDPKVFDADDDSEYRTWLRVHPNGHVVNGLDPIGRRLHRAYSGKPYPGAVWHRPICPLIGGSGFRMGSVKSYSRASTKACWETRAEIDEWRAREGSPELRWGPTCKSDGRQDLAAEVSRTYSRGTAFGSWRLQTWLAMAGQELSHLRARELLTVLDGAVDDLLRRQGFLIPTDHPNVLLARAEFLAKIKRARLGGYTLRGAYVHLYETLEDLTTEPILIDARDEESAATVLRALQEQ